MRAMILAAGRGSRMGTLTQDTPKPLLRIGKRYLIEFAILQLLQAGITEIVINLWYHAEKIKQALGDGRRYGATILYSEEESRLETGGGILKALPLLGDDSFLVLSADVISDFPLQRLQIDSKMLAHLVLIDNPGFHKKGDFGLQNKLLTLETKPYYTFANIGLYHPDLFQKCEPGHFPLSKLLFPAIAEQRISGEYFKGTWFNIGTPEDLAIACAHFNA